MGINEVILSLEMGLIYGIVAIGIYLTFRILNFPDLSCDGTFVLGAAVWGSTIQAGYSPYLALVLSLLVGFLGGLATGLLYTRFKVSDLLSGILVAFMLYSINLYIMGGRPNISLLDNHTLFCGNGLGTLVIISLIVWGGVSYLLNSDWGLALRSVGQNKILAQNNGVNIPLITLMGLALSNSLIALGGALFSQHQGFSDVGSGVGTLIVGLASVMIGERIFPRSSLRLKIVSCLLGSIFYRFLISLALHSEWLGLGTQNLNLITGVLIISIMMVRKKHYA